MLLFSAAVHGERTAQGAPFRFRADTVMGGLSTGSLSPGAVEERAALILSGEVKLDNGGGFIQMNADVGLDEGQPWEGFKAEVHGDGGPCTFLLKTTDLTFPWQSYRASVSAPARWTEIVVLFRELEPYRTDLPFRKERLRRLGLGVLGRPGPARLALAKIELFT